MLFVPAYKPRRPAVVVITDADVKRALTRSRIILTDGPVFCGGGSNQFDPDLLRIRKIRVMLRMQVPTSGLRGNDPTRWINPGTGGDGARQVPDYVVTFEVTPRNLNLAR